MDFRINDNFKRGRGSRRTHKERSSIDLSKNIKGSKAKSKNPTDSVTWPDLNYAHKDLRGKNFFRADLSNVNFTGSDLRGVNFRHANLEGANFVGAKLNRADFRFATLNKANLTKVKMHKGRFQNADIKEVSLKKAKFGPRVIMRGANFSKSNLRKADLSLINFRGFHHTAGTDIFRGRRTSFVGADLTSAKLIRIDAHGALFNEAILVNADLSNATAHRAQFTNANMYKTTIDGISVWQGMCPDGIVVTASPDLATCSQESIQMTPNYGAHLEI